MNNYYKSGSWNVICQVCGRKCKSDQVRKRWDGLIVCEEDFEQRHISDFIKVPTERISVPFNSPEPADTFISVACPYPTFGGMANIGTADCAIVGEFLLIGETTSLPIADIAIAGSFTPGEGFIL